MIIRPVSKQVLFSVLAAMYGVACQRKHECDFTHGRIRDYAFVGAVLTIGYFPSGIQWSEYMNYQIEVENIKCGSCESNVGRELCSRPNALVD